jgi:hypothetical protein
MMVGLVRKKNVAKCIKPLPSNKTAVDIDRLMYFTVNGLLVSTRKRGRKETERLKNFIYYSSSSYSTVQHLELLH